MAKKAKPGPAPERLQISGNYKAAVRKSLQVERPPEGWPDSRGKAATKKKTTKSPTAKKRGRAKA
jgi:hypothetical protein